MSPHTQMPPAQAPVAHVVPSVRLPWVQPPPAQMSSVQSLVSDGQVVRDWDNPSEAQVTRRPCASHADVLGVHTLH